ncbi:hypothetical protein As57867_015633, partial [Aphanomyces stellatus]
MRIFIPILLAVVVPAVLASPCNVTDGDIVTLQSDTGNFVARCNGCIPGATSPDSAFIHVASTTNAPYANWKVFNTGTGKLVFQADSGKYLARCSGCAPRAAVSDTAFVHVGDWHQQPWAQWTCIDIGGGIVALQADSGNYLARCNGCEPGSSLPDSATVHMNTYQGASWAQWTLKDLTPQVAATPPPAPVYTPAPTPGPACMINNGDIVTLQSDTGNYLARCNGCIPGATSPDSAFIHVASTANAPYANWKVFDTGLGKLVFQSDTGKYLARCNGCAPRAAVSDQAFVHVDDWRNQPWAQWKCIDIGGGKIALQADSGNYLARCNGCEPGSSLPDSATVHMNAYQGASWAQWVMKDLTPRPAPTPVPIWPTVQVAGPCSFTDGDLVLIQSATTGFNLTACGAQCPLFDGHDNPVFASWRFPYGTWWTIFNKGLGQVAIKFGMAWLAPSSGSIGSTFANEAAVIDTEFTWTCSDVGGGRVILQAGPKGYLAMGQTQPYPDQAVLNAMSTPDLSAAWTIKYLNRSTPGGASNATASQGPANVSAPIGDIWTPCNFTDGDLITLQADSNNFLARCEGCVPGAAYSNSATVHVNNADNAAYAQWKVFNTGNGKIALQADTKQFLSQCIGCAPRATVPAQAFVNAADWNNNPLAQWVCGDIGKNRIVLQSYGPKYLGNLQHCTGCEPGAATQEGAVISSSLAWAGIPSVIWTVKGINRPYSSPVLGTPSPYYAPVPAPTPQYTQQQYTPSPTTTWANFGSNYSASTGDIWTPCNFTDGDVITLQADSNNFLARCEGCVPGAAYSNSATVHVNNADNAAYAQWKVFNTGNGKIALQADTKQFLSQCIGCAPRATVPAQAFVNAADWNNNPLAQWVCGDIGKNRIVLQS